MTTMLDMVPWVVFGCVAPILGWCACLLSISRDPRIVTLKDGERVVKMQDGDLVVKGEVFDKLVAIAQVRVKHPEITYDKKGQLRKEFDPAGGEYGSDLDEEAGVERQDNPPR